MSRVVIDSAAASYSRALTASPELAADELITRAWRALPLAFSSSPIVRDRCISSCFWLAMTLAACSRSLRCCSWASVIACSSWTLGSARSSSEPLTLAARYFHHRFKALNMRRSLSALVDARFSPRPGSAGQALADVPGDVVAVGQLQDDSAGPVEPGVDHQDLVVAVDA